MQRYTVETEMMNTWENCWTDAFGRPVHYDSLDAAVDGIRDHITDCINAVEGGDMQDSPDPSEFRIVEETDSSNGWEVIAIYECISPAAAFIYEARA